MVKRTEQPAQSISPLSEQRAATGRRLILINGDAYRLRGGQKIEMGAINLVPQFILHLH